jgi:hypothetical protein
MRIVCYGVEHYMGGCDATTIWHAAIEETRGPPGASADFCPFHWRRQRLLGQEFTSGIEMPIVIAAIMVAITAAKIWLCETRDQPLCRYEYTI